MSAYFVETSNGRPIIIMARSEREVRTKIAGIVFIRESDPATALMAALSGGVSHYLEITDPLDPRLAKAGRLEVMERVT